MGSIYCVTIVPREPPPAHSLNAMEVEREAIAGLKWMTIAKLAGQGVSWAVTLIVLRLLSPADYGLMAISAVIISIMAESPSSDSARRSFRRELSTGASSRSSRAPSPHSTSDVAWS